MLRKILFALLLLIFVLITIVLINTFHFTKPLPRHTTVPITGIPDSAALHLSKALQIRTVSVSDTLPVDTTEFLRFRQFLEQTYPWVHQKLTRHIFNNFSYVYIWPGKNPSLKPYVLMAHTDVVPVEMAAEKAWSVAPFGGVITRDTIWGRGAVDDKASAIAILEATEQLLKKNYQPERTLYLCFGHDEEVAGTRGAKTIAAWFRQNNIHPELVLDEGGEINTRNLKELKRPVAVLGIGEKGYASFELSVEKAGGHSSMPEKETAIDILSAALNKLRQTQMKVRFTEPVQQMFQHLGPGMSFTNRMALANPWLFQGILIHQLEKAKETNAMIHTTVVPTILQAGIKDNVIPTVATAIINSRILPGETSADVARFLQTTIKDDRIQIKRMGAFAIEPSKTTSVNSNAYKKISAITYQIVPDVVVAPYLVIGATDARYFRDLADGVINFIPNVDSKGFHGIDERIGVADFRRMIFFYKMVLQDR